VDTWERLAAEQRELEELAQLAQEEDDASLTGDIGRGVGKLRRDVDRLEEESLLSGEFDSMRVTPS